MYLDGDNVRTDQIANGTISFNEENSPFNWVDLFAAGPATVVSWTSSYSETGVLGEPELATAEKGRASLRRSGQAIGAVHHLLQRSAHATCARDRHRQPPTMPMPWGQRPVTRGE